MGRITSTFNLRIAAVALFVAGAAVASAEDVRGAVDAANKQFQQAAAKGDARALSELYTSTAQALPPNGEPAVGREAIAKLFGGILAAGNPEIALTTTELSPAGDTAYEVGTYQIKAPDGNLLDRGKYVVIWKKEDGRWKLHRDIWNSSQPPGAR